MIEKQLLVPNPTLLFRLYYIPPISFEFQVWVDASSDGPLNVCGNIGMSINIRIIVYLPCSLRLQVEIPSCRLAPFHSKSLFFFKGNHTLRQADLEHPGTIE